MYIGSIYKIDFPASCEPTTGYIGQSLNYSNRIAGHKHKSHNSRIRNYVRKHGWENVVVTELARIYYNDKEIVNQRLNELEKDFIREYDTFHNGWNFTEGGEIGPTGYKWTEEQRSKRMGTGNPMYGKTPWNKGKTGYKRGPHTQETIEKIRKSKMGKKRPNISGDKHPRRTPEVISRDKDIIHRHFVLGHRECNIWKDMGIPRTNVARIIQKHRKELKSSEISLAPLSKKIS